MITELGTHAELVAKSGYYAAMYERQQASPGDSEEL
jgi:ABC-type multidrug transport system fused ATPase/permease subunit